MSAPTHSSEGGCALENMPTAIIESLRHHVVLEMSHGDWLQFHQDGARPRQLR